jgi:uracil-DNA glycosylase family 4
VPGEGPADADRWIVGLCPGREEAIEGRPFVGHAGRRLDKALSAGGIARSAIYVTNAVLCHPPSNRTELLGHELEACRDRLLDEIRQKRPRKLLALGAKATLQVTRDPTPIRELRKLPSVPFDGPTVGRVTWHPSQRGLNRDPARSKRFDEDVAWEPDLPQEIRASDIENLYLGGWQDVLRTAIKLAGNCHAAYLKARTGRTSALQPGGARGRLRQGPKDRQGGVFRSLRAPLLTPGFE